MHFFLKLYKKNTNAKNTKENNLADVDAKPHLLYSKL